MHDHVQLPTVSYRVIDDDPSLLVPAGVHSETVRHYGYNDFSDFNRPEHYIRYIEPIESELAVQVEYDMDEQDQAWLDSINVERKKDQSGPITYEVFEIIMDKLEKEWFNLVKRIPQPASHMPVEDSKCAVCDDGEGENSNAIVFCDGCNLAVHQDCYGVPYIPEGQWLCRKCTVSPENPVSCLVCPNEGGAFKQTTSGHWAHLLCAIWIPELMLGNAIYMEPIDGAEAIPKNRWKLICAICREKMGACIQCENRNCFTAFHVTCARQMGFLMAMKSVHNDGSLKAFCDKHLPDELRKDTFDDEFDIPFSETPVPKHHREPRSAGAAVTTKTARAHTKAYRPGPPIVPQLIVQALFDYAARLTIRKKAGFVEKLCRYWSLKREARRGAPLLKRLHLEPWTASNAGRQQTEAEKALKLSFLRMLRNDLEKVRMLAEQVRKREREKLRQAQIIKDVVDGFIFPGYEQLRLTLEKISAMDRNELFLHPVNRFEVPDYFQVIKEPLSWLQMDEKLEKNLYRDVESFKHDVGLVLDNAMLYNKTDSVFHKTAKRIKTNSQPLLLELKSIAAQSTICPPDEEADITSVPEEAVGNLEPSLLLLKSLLQTSNATPEKDNLAALFLFEMTRPRPPTPPPPSPPKKKEKAKPLTSEEKHKRWLEREAAAKERMAGRATRSTIHANSAFAQEVGLVPSDTEAHSRQTSGESRATARRSGRSKLAPVDQALAETQPAQMQRGSSSVGASADGPSEPRARGRQVGVVAVETVAFVSDKERRQQERELDLVTEQVDDMDQFKRFNVGWVLPAGTKRKRPESTSGGMLGVPRGRTITTSPLAPPAPLPTTPTPAIEDPVKDIEPDVEPPPSSPLSDMSDELTPAVSEADAARPTRKSSSPAETEILDEAKLIEAQPEVPDGTEIKPAAASKRKRRSMPFTNKRKKRKVTHAVQTETEDAGMDVDQEEVAPSGDIGEAPAETEEAVPGNVPETESEDDLTPAPETDMEVDREPPAASPEEAAPETTSVQCIPATHSRRRSGRHAEPDRPAEPAPEQQPVATPANITPVPEIHAPQSRRRSGRKAEAEVPAAPAPEQPVAEPVENTPVPDVPLPQSRRRPGKKAEPEVPAEPAPEQFVAEPGDYTPVPDIPLPHSRRRPGKKAEPEVPADSATEQPAPILPPSPLATRSSRWPGVKANPIPVPDTTPEPEQPATTATTPRRRSGRKADPTHATEPTPDAEPSMAEASSSNPKSNTRTKSGRFSRAKAEEVIDSVAISVEPENRPKAQTTPARKRSTRKSEPIQAPEAEIEEEVVQVEEAAPEPPTPSRRRSGRKSKVEAKEDVDEPESEPEPEPNAAEEDEETDQHIVVDSTASEDDDLYPVGTLVWARIPGYPYFPAEIIDPYDDDVEIPEIVLDRQPGEDEEHHWLIRFFDSTKSFAWIKEAKLDLLRESDEIDAMYLAGKERNRPKGFKSKREQEGCRKAYREALAQIAESGEEE